MKFKWIEPATWNDFAAECTDAHRICSAPDGWVERFGPDVLISFKTDAARERLTTELYLWATSIDYNPARVFARFVPRKNAERQAPSLIAGDPGAPLQAVVTERMLRYGIDFAAGYSVGLFLDQRANRHFVRQTAPARLLNCFAYTCSFSVAAGSVGAETTSVDLSKKSLARGRDNFALNFLPAEKHRFIADDVLEVLPRFERQKQTFDLIVLDPPTFSRSHRGTAFQVERDFEGLLLAALPVASRNARILLSTNCTTLAVPALEVMGRFCMKATRRAGSFHSEPALPDFPGGTGAHSVWMTLR